MLLLLVIVAISVIILYVSRNEEEGSNFFDLSSKDSYSVLEDRFVASFLPDSGAAFKYNSPTIVDDYLYLGTSEKLSMEGDHQAAYEGIHDNYFYKMDLDLNVTWQYPLGKTMVISAGVLDSHKNIYFLTETFVLNGEPVDPNNKDARNDIFLTTLNLVSLTNEGTLRWQKQAGEANEPWDHSTINLAISADDKIYFGHTRFYAYNIDGELTWQYPDENMHFIGFGSAPIIDASGNFYFVSPEAAPIDQNDSNETIKAYKFSSSGALIWSSELGNEPRLGEGPTQVGGERVNSSIQKQRQSVSIPSFGIGERALYSLVGCTVNKVDTQSGDLLWSLLPEGCTGGFIATPAIDTQDNLYVGTKSNLESTLFAISGDGTLLWKTLIGADLYTSPLLGNDNMVYTGSETTDQGKYYKIDMRTGEIQWVIGRAVSDFSNGSGALYNGYIYIGVHLMPDDTSNQPKKTLFKIQADTDAYLAGSPWPRFHGGNENTGRTE